MLGVRAPPPPRPRQHRALGGHLLAWVGPWVWPWVWRASSLWEGGFPRWANVCLRGAASAEDARAGLLAGQGRWPGGGARAGRPRARTWQGDRVFQQHVFAREDASRPGFRSAGAGRTQAECPGPPCAAGALRLSASAAGACRRASTLAWPPAPERPWRSHSGTHASRGPPSAAGHRGAGVRSTQTAKGNKTGGTRRGGCGPRGTSLCCGPWRQDRCILGNSRTSGVWCQGRHLLTRNVWTSLRSEAQAHSRMGAGRIRAAACPRVARAPGVLVSLGVWRKIHGGWPFFSRGSREMQPWRTAGPRVPARRPFRAAEGAVWWPSGLQCWARALMPQLRRGPPGSEQVL